MHVHTILLSYKCPCHLKHSAALQRIYSAAVPCFSFEIKSLRTDEKTHAERESKKRHKDPLKEAWLYTASLVIHDVVGCEVGSNGKPLILPPDRTTKRPHCTARHQHHATLHKPHTAAPTH